MDAENHGIVSCLVQRQSRQHITPPWMWRSANDARQCQTMSLASCWTGATHPFVRQACCQPSGQRAVEAWPAACTRRYGRPPSPWTWACLPTTTKCGSPCYVAHGCTDGTRPEVRAFVDWLVKKMETFTAKIRQATCATQGVNAGRSKTAMSNTNSHQYATDVTCPRMAAFSLEARTGSPQPQEALHQARMVLAISLPHLER